MSKKIKVLIVDDSETTCKLFQAILQQHPDISEIKIALDAFQAQPLLYDFQPDVITLDINMPRMDGLTFLKFINKHRPTPTIVVSALTQHGSEQALQAIEYGAFDVLAKPSHENPLTQLGPELLQKTKAAASSNPQKPSTPNTPAPISKISKDYRPDPNQILLLAASTGGTEAIKTFLSTLPSRFPPIAIVLHIQDLFSQTYAQRLNQSFPFLVKEAADNDPLLPNTVLIAPGDRLMHLKKSSTGYAVSIKNSPKPTLLSDHTSADTFFQSAAQITGPNCCAAILTGMGKDGAQGLLALKKAGALTAVQDQNSSLVFGMPKAALDIGATSTSLDINELAQHLLTPSLV